MSEREDRVMADKQAVSDTEMRLEDLIQAVKTSLRESAEVHAAQLAKVAKRAEERECDMHARIRAEYDRTIADSWRAKVEEVELKYANACAQLAALHTAAAETSRALRQYSRYYDDKDMDTDAEVLDRILSDTSAAANAFLASVRGDAAVDAMADFTSARIYEKERDEARAQLAALHARTQTLTNHLVASDGLMEPPPQTAVRANSWAFVSAVEDTRRLLADIATSKRRDDQQWGKTT